MVAELETTLIPIIGCTFADERPARAGLRLFITGLGIGQICSWGSVYYSFPLIAEAMGRDLGWSKPDLYGAATIGLLLSGLAAYPVGSAIDRGHGRTIMAGASVLAGILLIAWSQVESIAVFYILLAGIGCLQAAVLTESAFAVVSRRFGAANARGGIVALTLWAGFASTVFIPLIQFLLDHFGWRETLLVRVVAGALDNVQFDNLLLEQTQAPSGKAFRGRREGQRDQFASAAPSKIRRRAEFALYLRANTASNP